MCAPVRSAGCRPRDDVSAAGEALGLTGHRLDAADALYTGLATHFIPANRLGAVADALADGVGTPVDTVLERLGQQSPVEETQLEKVRGDFD